MFPIFPIIGAVWAGYSFWQGIMNPGGGGGQYQPPAQPPQQSQTIKILLIAAIGVGLLLLGWALFKKK